MNRISRRLAPLVGIAAAAIALAGCGASDPGTSDGREAVTMWGSWSGTQVAQLNQQAKAFNDSQSKYEVKYVAQEIVEEKLLTAIAGGQVPDLVLWDRYATALYAPKKALMPIDDLVKKDKVDMDAFYSPAVDELTVGDKLYGLPLLVDNRSLFYNKKMLADAGVEPPTTWEELKTAAEKLTVRDANGKLQRAGLLMDDPGLFNSYLWQAGGELLNKDETKVEYDSPAGHAVLDYWKSLLDAGVYESGFGDGVDAFAQGTAAMRLNGPWALADLDKVDGLDYGIVPPPAGPSGDTAAAMGGFGLVIPQGAKNSAGAWAFMKWWTTEAKNGVDFAKISGWIPANVEASKDPYFTEDEHYAAFIQTLQFAKVRPSVRGYSDVEGKALIPALQKFMIGEISADEALAEATSTGDKILKENRK
ncbi:ABC transporter substrate-binding protein [Schumannella luteola]|uniref:Multiple sugar transport system substrate-binding protein n=1 Tax=Schumannella luteola TaxID=472059 RepID=A0A852YA11_9MICO|nr:ABC transporter substrate-binding protein [Schumannella luteola]NYG98190.1 multiple sugar transport system substrate-binding protein [Schumannella luteola]TPW90482.1 ABC transporter substrate-binding protein [Schumannella luteola]